MALSGLEFCLGEVVGIDAAINALHAAVVDLFKTHDDRITDSGRVNCGNSANFVEPVGLGTLDAHLGSAGDRHGWAKERCNFERISLDAA